MMQLLISEKYIKGPFGEKVNTIHYACVADTLFCRCGEKLAEMAGTGDWQEGQRFRGSAGEEEVTEWVNGLGL